MKLNEMKIVPPETLEGQFAYKFKRLPLWLKTIYLAKTKGTYLTGQSADSPTTQTRRGGKLANSAERKQGGNEIRRMPDVAFQPESGLPFNLDENTGVNWAFYINLPAGCVYSSIPVIRFKVPNGMKLILTSIDFYFGSPYAPFLVDGSIFINAGMTEFPVAINRPCSCPYPYRMTVYGGQTITVKMNINFSEFYIGSFKASMRGFMVEDLYPADKRADM